NMLCNQLREGWRLRALMALAACAMVTQTAWAASPAIESTLPRMVKIFGAGGIRNLYSYSTGFLVSAEGHVVTVWSHVLDSESVAVALNDGRRFEAKVLGAEPQLDLAVIKLKTDAVDFPYFDLKQAVEVGPGTRILGFSNMFKVATGDEPVSVMHGVVAARTKLTTRRGAFETPYQGSVYVVDAITNNPGAGGGIITTRRGQLVGMIGKELQNARSNTWINYALPIEELRETVGEIITGRYKRREENPQEDSQLANYGPLDFGLVMVPDVLFRTPAFIDSVVGSSDAHKAGLRPNDLVMFANDELVHSCRSLTKELGRLEAGDTLRLIVRRDNQLVSVELAVPRKLKP
ncbi:MAG: trypsin-like peptidase domain-containing protein, partial [Planctomycetaceae bacterium]